MAGAGLLAGLLALAGCALGPQAREAPVVYDLGPPRGYPAVNPPLAAPLLIPVVAAPAWLETNGIVYRLAFQDPARTQFYSAARWAAPPAALLTQQLRGRFAAASASGVVTGHGGARADYALHVELEDFSQTFDTPGASRVVVRARATLVDLATRTLVAQRGFGVERAAPSADARGAVAAFGEASDELARGLLAWTGEQISGARRKPGAGR